MTENPEKYRLIVGLVSPRNQLVSLLVEAGALDFTADEFSRVLQASAISGFFQGEQQRIVPKAPELRRFKWLDAWYTMNVNFNAGLAADCQRSASGSLFGQRCV